MADPHATPDRVCRLGRGCVLEPGHAGQCVYKTHATPDRTATFDVGEVVPLPAVVLNVYETGWMKVSVNGEPLWLPPAQVELLSEEREAYLLREEECK